MDSKHKRIRTLSHTQASTTEADSFSGLSSTYGAVVSSSAVSHAYSILFIARNTLEQTAY